MLSLLDFRVDRAANEPREIALIRVVGFTILGALTFQFGIQAVGLFGGRILCSGLVAGAFSCLGFGLYTLLANH